MGGSATKGATPSSYIGDVSYLATQGDQATRRNMLRKVESPHRETTSTLYLYTCKVHITPCLNLQPRFTSLQNPRGFGGVLPQRAPHLTERGNLVRNNSFYGIGLDGAKTNIWPFWKQKVYNCIVEQI
jgi:hypothetical protein